MLAAQAFGLELSEWALIVAAVIFSVEVLGLSRSSRTLRRTNADLIERTATLEADNKTRDDEALILREEAARLRREVAELKARSVESLFAAYQEFAERFRLHDDALRAHDERMTVHATGAAAALLHLGEEVAAHEDRAQERHDAFLEALNELVHSIKEG